MVNVGGLVDPVQTVGEQAEAEHDQEEAAENEKRGAEYQGNDPHGAVSNPQSSAVFLPVHIFPFYRKAVKLIQDGYQW
jgi:hypothetical protein